MDIAGLRDLLPLLREHGVTRYQTNDLTLELSAPAPVYRELVEPVASPEDADKETEAKLRELDRLEFAHERLGSLV